MLEKAEYNKVAHKLENDLNERFTRIQWKVDDYGERSKRAIKLREWWKQPQRSEDATITVAPRDAFVGTMSSFRINFSMSINAVHLMGATEMDGRLITDSSTDAISIIGEMVAHEIANELLTE